MCTLSASSCTSWRSKQMALSIFYHQTHFSSLPDKNKFSIALKSDKRQGIENSCVPTFFSAVFATFMVWLRSGYGISSSTSQFRKSFAATSANISLLSDMTISLKNLNYILEIKKPQKLTTPPPLSSFLTLAKLCFWKPSNFFNHVYVHLLLS